MKSLRNLEGYILFDHRNSPGVNDTQSLQAGLPPGAGRGIFESAAYTCGHCQAIVMVNPDRSRERTFCRKCQHIICDGCAFVMSKTLECRPFEKWADEVLVAAIAAQTQEF